MDLTTSVEVVREVTSQVGVTASVAATASNTVTIIQSTDPSWIERLLTFIQHLI